MAMTPSMATHSCKLRERDIVTLFPDMNVVFSDVLHNDGELFKRCIHHFITLTNDFALLVS